MQDNAARAAGSCMRPFGPLGTARLGHGSLLGAAARPVRTRRDGLRRWDADAFAVEPFESGAKALASRRTLSRSSGSDMARYARKSSPASRVSKGSASPALGRAAADVGASTTPSKKNVIGTPKTLPNSYRRPALIRFLPCSYLYTC